MERLTCNELKTIRDGFFIHKGNREDGAKYRILAESAPKYEEIYRKLAEYEDSEEQGLLLRLPCKVGDNVYKIWSCGKNGKSVAEFRISHIDIDDLQNIEFAFISTKNISTSYWFCKIGDFGKTVFLTKEEAELELANRQQSHAEAIMDERNGR